MTVHAYTKSGLIFRSLLAGVLLALYGIFAAGFFSNQCDVNGSVLGSLGIAFVTTVVAAVISIFIFIPRPLWFKGQELRTLGFENNPIASLLKIIVVGVFIYHSYLLLSC